MTLAQRCIREFLNEWDPIGVNAALLEDGLELNEYDDYVSALHRAALMGPAEIQEALAKMLEDMGLSRSAGELQLRAQQLAARLVKHLQGKSTE